ncbi:MAG: hypothetical protein WA871_07545 [Candidatus Acidiferrales bacterium]
MTKFAVPIVVRDFEVTEFGSETAIRKAIEHIAGAQVVGHCRANKVFIVSAENERAAEALVGRHCKDHDVHAVRIDRPIEAETL